MIVVETFHQYNVARKATSCRQIQIISRHIPRDSSVSPLLLSRKYKFVHIIQSNLLFLGFWRRPCKNIYLCYSNHSKRSLIRFTPALRSERSSRVLVPTTFFETYVLEDKIAWFRIGSRVSKHSNSAAAPV